MTHGKNNVDELPAQCPVCNEEPVAEVVEGIRACVACARALRWHNDHVESLDDRILSKMYDMGRAGIEPRRWWSVPAWVQWLYVLSVVFLFGYWLG